MQKWRLLEAKLLSIKVLIPVYFAPEDSGLTLMHKKLTENAQKESKSSVVSRKILIITCYPTQAKHATIYVGGGIWIILLENSLGTLKFLV